MFNFNTAPLETHNDGDIDDPWYCYQAVRPFVDEGVSHLFSCLLCGICCNTADSLWD